MGEYARQYILDHHGVDIGDDEPVRKNQRKRHGCSCGRVFKFKHALEDHQKDTGHANGQVKTATP